MYESSKWNDKTPSKSEKVQEKIEAEAFKMKGVWFERDGISFSTKYELDEYIAEKQAESERKRILKQAESERKRIQKKADSINIEDFKCDVPGYTYSKDGQMFKTKKEFKAYIDSQK